jgi:selenocysteine-specific elongation factor
VVIIQKGGSRILGSGVVIWKGVTSTEQRRKLSEEAKKISLPLSGEALLRLELAVNGFARNISANSRWLFSPEMYESCSLKLKTLSGVPGGIGKVELKSKLAVPEDALKDLCTILVKEGTIIEKDGYYFDPKNAEAQLSPLSKKIISEIENTGRNGFDPSGQSLPGLQKELRQLGRAGLIIPLAENIFYSVRMFKEMSDSILAGLTSGDSFDIAHAKDRTGLSRKYIIPILNRMEEKKLIRRQDPLRIVI